MITMRLKITSHLENVLTKFWNKQVSIIHKNIDFKSENADKNVMRYVNCLHYQLYNDK